ncbi:hypothetical protein S7711_02507 [Stachybotrys chartarum IBT 7711]|uniref:RING-CH-type domain-containing protein n=1 Tax=Stachybotrys chartarum (strain CBS 109288 / IBT 7711) TaxID=1280523 RepID=A0A084B590_STACB|nr:hypothetical protein S7711_02507 [Stachybotrys chartarum IBT 7711]KFA50486.1 hypothetical protein S40293_03096 [Stachybotrys chartarum IBT 40293]
MDAQPTWDWSSVGDNPAQSADKPTTQLRPDEPPASNSHNRDRPRASGRQYGPRTCRICLENVYPTFEGGAASTLGLPSSSRPTYVSEDPELGRLLSPCKCKGSQKYVHEGCLQAWRLANPTATRNYWSCPTCKFTYRMARLQWAALLTSKWAQSALTLIVLLLCVFVFGFIADPILDFWFDPMGTISETLTSVITDVEAMDPPRYAESSSWQDHFLKGFFSLGLLGFLKSMLAMSPWQWFNIRTNGGLGSRRGGTGRARVDNINILYVLIGVVTFLVGTWKVVNAVSSRVLKNVSDRVVDIGEDDDDETAEDAARKDQ